MAGAVERAAAALGGLDVLVNNAGVAALGPLQDLSPAEVDHTLPVHVRGVFLTSPAAAARMAAGGRIITIGSCLTRRAPGPGGTLCATSEAALVGLTKAPAHELAVRGITANIVHPGPTDTDMNRRRALRGRPGGDDRARPLRDGRRGGVGGGPSGRCRTSYVTGDELVVDGGFAA